MGHIKWLFVFVTCFSVRKAICDLSINMKDTVIGVRGLSVDIPCTYSPSKDYEEVEVEWFLEYKVIIHRIESQDHIPLTEFRKRVEISKSPGDVSLGIRKLSSGDKGNVKCKVTWKKNDGTKISKEEVTKLTILRMNLTTEKPKVNILTTHQERETTTPITEKHDPTIIPKVTTAIPVTEKHVATISPKVTTAIPVTEKHDATISPKVTTAIPVTEKHDATISPKVTTGIPHFGTVSTMEITKLTTNVKVRKSTTVISLNTTKKFYSNAAIAQKTDFGMPLYVLIVIIICVVCIMTLVLVLIIKKKKKNIYELPTMNQLLALEGAGNGCQSCTDETRASNTYEPCNPPPVSVYEGIVLPFSNEYDLLIMERTPENDCS